MAVDCDTKGMQCSYQDLDAVLVLGPILPCIWDWTFDQWKETRNRHPEDVECCVLKCAAGACKSKGGFWPYSGSSKTTFKTVPKDIQDREATMTVHCVVLYLSLYLRWSPSARIFARRTRRTGSACSEEKTRILKLTSRSGAASENWEQDRTTTWVWWEWRSALDWQCQHIESMQW